ncbi:MAG: hypothetical protein ACTTIO_02500 [Candidatus Fimenecus sp.]
MRKLPSLTEMEHITSKEFGENMDAFLDRVTDEDIAFIIDHNSKSYVLCPASWFELPELKHLELMIKNAVRFVAIIDDSELTETVQMVDKWKHEQWDMSIPSRLINVGCMMDYMRYTPRTLEELLDANPMPVFDRIRQDGAPIDTPTEDTGNG